MKGDKWKDNTGWDNSKQDDKGRNNRKCHRRGVIIERGINREGIIKRDIRQIEINREGNIARE